MKRSKYFSSILPMLAAAFLAIGQSTPATAADQLDAPGLRQMLVKLGYEVKDLNPTKFQIPMKRDGLDVPIAAEVSASKNYVWLTANLGQNRASLGFENLLKQNMFIQPSFFYITNKSDRLMIGLPINNQALSEAVMTRSIEKLTADVAATKAYWQQ